MTIAEDVASKQHVTLSRGNLRFIEEYLEKEGVVTIKTYQKRLMRSVIFF